VGIALNAMAAMAPALKKQLSNWVKAKDINLIWTHVRVVRFVMSNVLATPLK
jgi:hypothetical protein